MLISAGYILAKDQSVLVVCGLSLDPGRTGTPLVASGLTQLWGNAPGFLSHSSIFQD